MASPKPTWTSVKPAIAALDRNGLLGLVKDLFDASPENRNFLIARFKEDDSEAAIEEYRRRIVEQFFPKRGFGNPKLSVCRKQISDYRKARGDVAGLAELMLVYLESGVSYCQEYGYYDESLLWSMGSIAASLKSHLVTSEGLHVYGRIRDRIISVNVATRSIAGGNLLGDELLELEAEFKDWEDDRPEVEEAKKYEPDF